MRVLLVHCHPLQASYSVALRERAASALRAGGHELRVIDLYGEGFDPVLSAAERERYLVDSAANVQGVAEHVSSLLWAEGLLFVFPTWFYGPPAMLKGWLERTWLPGVAFTVPARKGDKPGAGMRHIRWLGCITTSGSPWWWLKVIGDPGRSLLMKGLRPLYAKRCRMKWLQLYNMNHVSAADREAFLARVQRELSAL